MPALRVPSSTKNSRHAEKSAGAKIGFDSDGRIIFASASAAIALGYELPGELEGQMLADLIGNGASDSMLENIEGTAEQKVSTESSSDPSTITFVHRDGSHIQILAAITPNPSGGEILLINSPASSRTERVNSPNSVEVAATLRALADQSAPSGGERDICARFAETIRSLAGSDALLVARSTGTAGLYEAVAHSTKPEIEIVSDAIDLPPALIPQRSAGPVSVESLEGLALFDPVIIGGEEATGAYLAARSEYLDGTHILLITTSPEAVPWSDEMSLLLETGALTLSGTLRAAELGDRLASSARAHEAIRQIGVLASQDLDGGFLEAARRVIARRLPVAAISIHVADHVTSRCYVAASTGSDSEGLAPGFEWPLAGSIEQRVLKSGTALFISASSPERVAVPPTTVAHWRAAGLQTVVAVPLREAGEVIAVLVAGFASALSGSNEVVRLLESITPAVHLGVGLSGGRPGAAPEPEDSSADPGFVAPKLLLAITRAAAESPDAATLFASVTEWLLEIIPSSRVAWGTVDQAARTYHRIYNYDPTSAINEREESVEIADSEYESLSSSGMQLPEPGHPGSGQNSMRVAIADNQRVLGVVTAWSREDEIYTSTDVARLERICEFIAGPLQRLHETQTAIEARLANESVHQLGVQATGFYDPTTAFRAIRPLLSKLLPNDRMLFVEIDRLADTAAVQYDSAVSINGPCMPDIQLGSLPSPEIVDAETPLSMPVFNRSSKSAEQLNPMFTDYRSLLSIPVHSGEGLLCALLLLSEKQDAFTGMHLDLATSLSRQLTGARAVWDAHRTTRQWTRDLRDTRKQLNLLLDSAPIALVTTDANGICTHLEGHGLETLGINREEMHGKSVFELTGKMPQLEEAIRQALRGIPATAVTSQGSHSAEVWAQPITGTDGSVQGVTIVGYDISERARNKQVVAEVKDLQRTIRDHSGFVSTVAHDLRNTLLPIMNYTDILTVAGGNKQSPEQEQALSIILKSAQQLNTLIGDLLSMDTGRHELDICPVNVNKLMHEIVDAQLPTFKKAQQTVTLSLPNTECIVEADNLRLTQVVTNLLSNASKHSQPGAEVCVDVALSESSLKISVIDNGPGIPSDQLERVWGLGVRLQSTESRAVPGRGLGLTIVRKLVELHGGTATMESAVGIGTTATITLPGAREMRSTQADDENEDASSKSSAGRRTRQRRAS